MKVVSRTHWCTSDVINWLHLFLHITPQPYLCDVIRLRHKRIRSTQLPLTSHDIRFRCVWLPVNVTSALSSLIVCIFYRQLHIRYRIGWDYITAYCSMEIVGWIIVGWCRVHNCGGGRRGRLMRGRDEQVREGGEIYRHLFSRTRLFSAHQWILDDVYNYSSVCTNRWPGQICHVIDDKELSGDYRGSCHGCCHVCRWHSHDMEMITCTEWTECTEVLYHLILSRVRMKSIASDGNHTVDNVVCLVT